MSKVTFEILNEINQGLIILNENLYIKYWNNLMEEITGIKREETIGHFIYDVLPNLNRNYFHLSLDKALTSDYKPFFSAAMHKGLITDKAELNLRISTYNNNKEKLIMIECTDVTGEFVRVKQLKNNLETLSHLNKKLKEKEKEITKLAYYDNLTEVANRTLFFLRAEKLLETAKLNNKSLGLLFIDVDKFKCINDKFGHEVGDEVLKKVANLLLQTTRANDVVARYGGDEFVILLPGFTSLNDYENVVSRLFKNVPRLKIKKHPELTISLSIGASFYPRDGNSIRELIYKADLAMYSAKKKGGNHCLCYHNKMVSC